MGTARTRTRRRRQRGRTPDRAARPVRDAPWPVAGGAQRPAGRTLLVFPVSSIVREARPRIPPTRLVGTLRALADDTRLRALRLLAERPRSTQELAPLIGVGEAALSKHLRVLADAGLVERRREGYCVLYRLAPGQVAGLPPSLEASCTAMARRLISHLPNLRVSLAAASGS
ncbi:metalloregulator ArsR/SmtB family transcription factor [Streptomyces sp. NPDC012616]|uniref:ArsR/SmtB family transcription factor n=1 Tax=Streptomyces sp. NPDC012616 TaxID=3364840 RepID=UPI0036E78AB5